MKRLIYHVGSWLSILAFWVLFSRNHHPTWLLNILASSVLVGASATAVYINALILWPRNATSKRWLRYAAGLILLIVALDLLAVVVIQLVYDLIHGPDPARYGFWTNVKLEAVFIGFHVAVAAGVVAVVRWIKRGRAY